MKTLIIKIFIVSFLIILISCGDDSNDNATNPSTTPAALEGSWKVEEVQILSAPTVNPGIWKPALVIWGNVQASTIGNLEITFQANGNWIAAGYLTNTAIKAMVKDYQAGTSYNANGRYTVDSSSITMHLDNYTGRGPTMGQANCSYSISGNKMTFILDLYNNEKWKVILSKI